MKRKNSFAPRTTWWRGAKSAWTTAGFRGYLPQASEEQCKSVGQFYEMVVTRLTEAVTEFPEAKPIQVPRPYASPKSNEIRLCPALFQKYPVFWWSQTYFEECVFRRLEPLLDCAYFEVVVFEV
ncbi:hypothetical protein KIH39_08695 [Telmatocola sphagniphila]|uniref:Uncharacterized protein n=1 Tax=Telmatocola sphagniphila TaxID=1123043 RepID=A0A8E6EZP5_9BACT|nr:hypothetical protein [Telmatocola sphagniphila]QVL33968.1 hypothetical protein KIH39_08695 [Telmatocola sphagniphila]